MTIRTVADIIRVNASRMPDSDALAFGDRRVTWGELYERAQRFAGVLTEAGIGSDDRVAFLEQNGIEHFEVLYGSALVNAVIVELNWRLAAVELEYIISDSQARALVVGAEYGHIVEQIASKLTSVEIILVIGADDSSRFENYDAALRRCHEPGSLVPGGPDDVAFQLYSSGTTGRPKGVLLTNNNFFALADVADELWGFDEHVVSLVAMPLFHIGGVGWATIGMRYGCLSVIVRDVNPRNLIETIGREGITHAFLVPAVMQFMLLDSRAERTDYSTLQVIVYGSSPISESVLARSADVFGCDLWHAYGLTETSGAVVNLPPADHDVSGASRHRLRSCGRPGPGVEIRIVDTETMRDRPANQVGEVWIRSKQVMKGYWNLPDATAHAITSEGWFRSGDAGYLDPEGYLYIHDRVKDMIVSGGENVYPAEVENVLMEHPALVDAAVIGVPDDTWGEAVKALVVRARGSHVSEREVIDFVRARLAHFKCPKSVEWRAELPRNPSGKLLKRALREPYWTDRDRQVN